MMPEWMISAVRTGVQGGWTALATWMVSLGVTLPATAPEWVTPAVVTVLLALVTAAIRWLETRRSSWARRLARWMMCGIARHPVYTRQR